MKITGRTESEKPWQSACIQRALQKEKIDKVSLIADFKSNELGNQVFIERYRLVFQGRLRETYYDFYIEAKQILRKFNAVRRML